LRKLAFITTTFLLSIAFVSSGCTENPMETAEDQSAEDIPGTGSDTLSGSGNCLSMPVVFAEGHGLTGEDLTQFTGLRGTPGFERFLEPGEDTLIDGYPVYRNPSANEWCADWADGTTWGEVGVRLDWADNMTHQTWTDRSKVRVEVVLYTDNIDPLVHPLTGYNMYSLGGEKLDEVFVTNTTTYLATTATVYSNVARLKIEKLDAQGGEPVMVIYDSPCYDKYFVDGPTDAYSAEVNMGGKCIYGFNWDVRAVDLAVRSGWYRLTFSLDAEASYTDYDGVVHTYPRNTLIASLDPADLLDYSEQEAVIYSPTLADDGYSSVLEIFIEDGRSDR
jgi:hypothetical protein